MAPGSSGPLVPPSDYESAHALAGNGTYGRFFHAMLRRGVALAPGPYEVMFPGMAHDEQLLSRVVEAAAEAAAEVAADGHGWRGRAARRSGGWAGQPRRVDAWRSAVPGAPGDISKTINRFVDSF